MAQWIVFSLNTQWPRVYPGVPEIISEKKLSMLPKLIDSSAASRSGQQRLYKVDRTHLVLWLVAIWNYKKDGCWAIKLEETEPKAPLL